LDYFFRQNSEANWAGIFVPPLPPSPYHTASSRGSGGLGSNDNFVVDEFILPSSNIEFPPSFQDLSIRGILSPGASENSESRNQYTYHGDHSSDLVSS
jgi:hypothetical protein